MGEEWWSSVLQEGCVWITHTSNTRICINTQGWQGAKIEWSKEQDRPGAGEEGYAAFYAGCEGSERNGMRHLRSPYCTV